MILVEDKYLVLTTDIGSAAHTFGGYIRKQIRKIVIEPATSTTSYDFTITDRNGLVVYGRTGFTGKFIDDKIEENVYGNFTLDIFNASADEEFKILLVFKEIVY